MVSILQILHDERSVAQHQEWLRKYKRHILLLDLDETTGQNDARPKNQATVVKKPLKVALSMVVLVIVVIAVIGFVLPSTYVVEKEIVIQSDPAAIHVYVDDLTKWPQWGPWHEKDPSIITTLGGITRGVGASQSWTGDSGSGELTFTASNPASGIEYESLLRRWRICLCCSR